VTGGYNEEQVKFCLAGYVKQILTAMKIINPELKLTITNILLKNRMCSNKLELQQIQAQELVDFLRSKNQNVVHHEEQINIVVYKPFPITNKSVTLFIFPAGGVNITGFKAFYEAEKAQEILCSILKPFLRQQPGITDDDRLKYRFLREKDEIRTQYKNVQKKLKKINEWNLYKLENEKKNVYENWLIKYGSDYLEQYKKEKDERMKKNHNRPASVVKLKKRKANETEDETSSS
jgi:TATA-box binding protein (TBP) (component of TFIID and TFIIIB)